MSYKPKDLAVADGGTGVSSATAYAILCGGTTATGPLQSIASVGTSGQYLTSNGASALPTFQTKTGYLVFSSWGSTKFNPADSTPYYVNFTVGLNATQNIESSRMYVPIASTLVACYGDIYVSGTLGSSENVTLSLLINGTTDVTLTATSQWTAVNNSFSKTGMSTSLSAGDSIQFKISPPAWTTNPTQITTTATILLSYGL